MFIIVKQNGFPPRDTHIRRNQDKPYPWHTIHQRSKRKSKFRTAITSLARLDFWTFVISGPSTEGQCLQDTFTLSGGRGSRGTPIICGTNSGDHGKQVFLALALALIKAHLK